LDISRSETLVELLDEHLVGSGESKSRGKFESKLTSVRDVLSWRDKWNKVCFVNINCVNLSSSVNSNHTIGGVVAYTNRRKLVRDSLAVDHSTSRAFKHEEVSEFGQDENKSIFAASLHKNGEITNSVGSHLHINLDSMFLSTGSGVSNFHNVELVNWFFGFLLAEANETVLVANVVSDWHLYETSGVGIQKLRLLDFSVEKLHACVQALLIGRV
jgi:hypothetical protein